MQQLEAPRARPFVENLPASDLSWPGASPDQLAFMRDVYDRHVARSARSRAFVDDVPATNLATVGGSVTMQTDAARSCRSMLDAANAELRRQVASGTADAANVAIGAVSGYRSASHQLHIWQTNFPKYFAATTAIREATGDPLGVDAANALVNYIAARIAAPGYSLHNSGLAIDLTTRESGRTLGASGADITAWRTSWFFTWLSSNAAQFGFYQNTNINEPWHWEYRPQSSARQSVESLIESISRETVTTPQGEMHLSNTPLLSGTRGTQPDLVLRWNDLQDSAPLVDIVVHFHGYSGDRDRMSLVRGKLPKSGLDFSNPSDTSDTTPGRTRPTLAILPRGNYFGGRSGMGYDFPTLTASDGLDRLIDYGVQQFAARVGLTGLRRGRLIVTAHSGGGAALLAMLRNSSLDPDEIYVFDGLYTSAPQPLIDWTLRHLSADAVALVGSTGSAPTAPGSGLCVIYRPCFANHQTHQMEASGTKAGSEAVLRAMGAVLSHGSAVLTDYYRVFSTNVPHDDIPGQFGWRLLASAASPLPRATQLTSAGPMPICSGSI